VSTAEPKPGTETMSAVCDHCGERITATYSRRAARYVDWRHTGPPHAGLPNCHPGMVIDYRNEKAQGLR
jgi:hypothetical protein